ncbi:kinase-like domain-containing protein [Xylariaceae sp. FL0255]|nr:kinase-like domain-containing protein [Xylariaceae sp. FL0255]
MDQVLHELDAWKIKSDRNHFIPDAIFDRIIRGTSGDSPYSLVSRMIEEVRTSFRMLPSDKEIIPDGVKIFIALLRARQPQMIDEFFIKGKLNDCKMPFSEAELRFILPDNVTASTLRIVYDNLMLLSAPKLKEGVFTIFDSTVPLPFLQILPFRGRHGQNSSMQIVWVPLEHLDCACGSIPPQNVSAGRWEGYHSNDDIERVELIWKKVLDPEIGWKERGNLEWLPRHGNLLRPICTFEVRAKNRTESMNFLFPKLDGTLDELLSREKDDWDWGPYELILAFSGLMAGLSAFSQPVNPSSRIRDIGIHNDLKPSNILVDEEQKKLVLCDFGSASLKTVYNRQDQSVSEITNAYLAPEALNRGNCSLGTKRDIWAMGCMLAEAVIYASSPSSHTIDDLTKARKISMGMSCPFFHDGVHIHTQIDKELSAITAPELKAAAVLIREMLHHTPSKRPSAEYIAERLKEIALSATNDTHTSFQEITLPLASRGAVSSSGDSAVSRGVHREKCHDPATLDELQVTEDTPELRFPPHIKLLLERKSKEVGSILAKGNMMMERVETKFSGRIRALWKGPNEPCSIKRWAASPTSSLIVVHSFEGDMETMMTIVAARIVRDSARSSRYHTISHLGSRSSSVDVKVGEPWALASSLLGQLVCSKLCKPRPDLLRVLDQEEKDVDKIMKEFVLAITTAPCATPIIIILDRINSFRDGKALWEEMWKIIKPLVALVRSPPSCGPPIKLFISTGMLPKDTGWEYLAGHIINGPKKHGYERKVDLVGFWDRNRLPWFGTETQVSEDA